MVIYGSAFVPYQPASHDTNQATFWSDTSQTTDGRGYWKDDNPEHAMGLGSSCPSGGTVMPESDLVCLLNGATFNPNLLYEMVFTAANPLVLGVGFAAMRDLVSFLRYGTTAPGGGSNPIAGTVTKAMNIGSSQSGAFIRGSIFYGFNEDEAGRIVFDGAFPQIDGRMMWMNERWAQPNVIPNLYMGGDEAPVWWADFPNQARGLPAASMLDRCNASGTCPQIVEYFGSNEFYDEKMAPDMTGFCVFARPTSRCHRMSIGTTCQAPRMAAAAAALTGVLPPLRWAPVAACILPIPIRSRRPTMRCSPTSSSSL